MWHSLARDAGTERDVYAGGSVSQVFSHFESSGMTGWPLRVGQGKYG